MSTTADQERAGGLLREARRLMELQRTQEAIPLLNEALRLDPDNSELRFQAGALAVRQGAPDMAMRHLEACVARDPEHAGAWIQLGTCHTMARRHAEAAQAYRRARAGRGPENQPSWRLARALRLSGDLAGAEQALHEVFAQANAETAAFHELALLCLAQGRRDAAERAWRRLAALDSASLMGAGARARLAMLDDPPVTAPDARRVAFHLKSGFHEAVLRPGYLACRGRHHVLVSSEAEEMIAFDPDVIVACDSHLAGLKRLMPRAITVQTRHGMGSKGHALLLGRTCDHLCLSHARQEAFFTDQGVHPPGGFWPIGYLQLDPLLNGSLEPAAVPRRPDRPVVLFAPTIGDSVSALGMLGDDPVAALRPGDDSFTLVIKAHPETRMRHPAWWKSLAAAAARHRDVVLVEDTATDIMPYVAACDLMVTDVSSVMFFAVAIDRPLVLLSNPARHAVAERFDPNGPEWRWRCVGAEIEDGAMAAAAIVAELADPARHAAARQACRDDMLGDLTDGRAGERLAGAIAELASGA